MKKSLLKQMLLLAVCATGVNHIHAQINPSLMSEPVRHTIAPGRSTAIDITTMPAAVCTLHPEGQEDGKHSLKLFADDEGIIRFHVRPIAETEQHEQLAADCQADGKTTTQRIELRAATSSTAAFPAPGALQANQPRQKGNVRPALTGDPMLLSESELLQRGYPPRPDPQKAPQSYASWLRAVSQPSVRVAPRTARRTDTVHRPAMTTAPGISSNWCGYALVGGPSPFNWVMGEWNVPKVELEGHDFFGSSQTESSLWIGLDGYGSGDVVQDGTEQDTFSSLFSNYASYSAFYEWYPSNSVTIPNFVVDPGDDIFSEVWVANSSGPRDAFGNLGFFYIENLTKNTHPPLFITPIPLGTQFFGNSAEWIMERGRNDPPDTPADLTNFGNVIMSSAAATRQNWDYPLYSQEPNVAIDMFNGAIPLCATWPVPNNPAAMQFQWFNFK